METDTIEAMAYALTGRRVLKVEPRIYPSDEEYDRAIVADYPVLYLDDGSEVVILTEWGFPPIVDIEKEPWVDPILWTGDNG